MEKFEEDPKSHKEIATRKKVEQHIKDMIAESSIFIHNNIEMLIQVFGNDKSISSLELRSRLKSHFATDQKADTFIKDLEKHNCISLDKENKYVNSLTFYLHPYKKDELGNPLVIDIQKK